MKFRRRGAIRHRPSAPITQRLVGFRELIRQGLMWTLLLGLSVTAYQSVAQLLDARRYPVRQVLLRNELVQLNPTEVEALLLPLLGQNFFIANLWTTQRQLQALPWVASARVERHWPDRVEVELTEHVPVAHWGQSMVTAGGEVFTPTTFRQVENWPRLNGLPGQEKAVLSAFYLAKELLDPLNLTVIGLRQDEREAWTVLLTNGVVLEVGREHFAERLTLFVKSYPQALAARISEVQAVDLRYDQGFAVRWRSRSG